MPTMTRTFAFVLALFALAPAALPAALAASTPDYAVSEIVVFRSNFDPDYVVLEARVKDLANALGAPRPEVAFELDGVEIARAEATGFLAGVDLPGSGHTYQTRIPRQANASHDLRVVVDPDDAIHETDETNNARQTRFSTGRDVAALAIHLEPVSPYADHDFRAVVDLAQQGDVQTASLAVRLYLDDVLHAERPTDPSTRSVAFVLNATHGEHTLRAEVVAPDDVDPANDVVERPFYARHVGEPPREAVDVRVHLRVEEVVDGVYALERVVPFRDDPHALYARLTCASGVEATARVTTTKGTEIVTCDGRSRSSTAGSETRVPITGSTILVDGGGPPDQEAALDGVFAHAPVLSVQMSAVGEGLVALEVASRR